MQRLNNSIERYKGSSGKIDKDQLFHLLAAHIDYLEDIVDELISLVPPELALTSKVPALRDYYKEDENVESV